MTYTENSYEFKKLLLNVHKKNVRDYSIKKGTSDFEFTDRTIILLPSDIDDVILNATRDFEDYLFTSMNVSVCLLRNCNDEKNVVKILLNKDIGSASGIWDIVYL